MKVLGLIDGGLKPAMRYVHEAKDKSKSIYRITLLTRKITMEESGRSWMNPESYIYTGLYMQLAITSSQSKNIFNYPSTLPCKIQYY